MDPITGAVVTQGAARLADVLFTALLAGIERSVLVDLVRRRETEGATLDQISDEIEGLRIASENEAQAAIDEQRRLEEEGRN